VLSLRLICLCKLLHAAEVFVNDIHQILVWEEESAQGRLPNTDGRSDEKVHHVPCYELPVHISAIIFFPIPTN